MNTLYTFKGKVLILSFAFFALSYALTDAIHLFGMAKHDVAQLGEHEAIPVIVLGDGENKKIMAVNEFFRSVSSNPNLTADDIAKVVKLKSEIELGKAQIDLFKKLTEKKETPKDSFVKSKIKQGGNKVLDLIKFVTGPIISGATTVAIIGGVAVTVLWYLGYFKGEYMGTIPTPIDYKIEPSLGSTTNVVPNDYTYTDSSGVTISYKDHLCADHGFFYNTFFYPNDCPK